MFMTLNMHPLTLNYCPPEMIGEWVYKMNQVLVTHIGENPAPGWQTDLINAYIQ